MNIFANFNPIFIVIPILFLLTFNLGTKLKITNFKQLYYSPKAVLIGLFSQIIILPLFAILIGKFFALSNIFQLGLLLIAASSGGSSSALFTYLIKGDLELSILLTTCSALLSIFTLPFWLFIVFQSEITYLILLKIIGQNLILCLLPLILGFYIHKYSNNNKLYLCILNKLNALIFPLLILVTTLFFIQHFATLQTSGLTLFISVLCLIISAMSFIYIINFVDYFNLFKLNNAAQKRTLVIEVGIQNAAQAITIAISPLTFNSEILAIPAIIYALLMNFVLIFYIFYAMIIRKKTTFY